jgi:predicted nucleotidyltransferase
MDIEPGDWIMTKQLENEIRKAAQILKSYGATEVYLFGSRAAGKAGDDSDVDMAVRGLPDEVYFTASARAGAVLSVSMDLITLDDPTPFVEYLIKTEALLRVA